MTSASSPQRAEVLAPSCPSRPSFARRASGRHLDAQHPGRKWGVGDRSQLRRRARRRRSRVARQRAALFEGRVPRAVCCTAARRRVGAWGSHRRGERCREGGRGGRGRGGDSSCRSGGPLATLPAGNWERSVWWLGGGPIWWPPHLRISQCLTTRSHDEVACGVAGAWGAGARGSPGWDGGHR